MKNIKIDHSKEPIRLFKSDFMEFFTHIHPAVVIVIWLPVSVFFLAAGILNPTQNIGISLMIVGFLGGLFLWTFAEYMLHRFLFHYEAKTEQMQKIFFLFHGVHHAQPQCKTRLVMPPVVSIPLALIFYGLFTLIFQTLLNVGILVGPVFSGFILGYLIYDLTHYATHHFPMRSGYFKFIKRYHMLHHYKTPDKRFGVSSPLWDFVFATPGDKSQV